MRFRRAVIAGVGVEVPDDVMTSTEIERRLAPLYARLQLHEGRIELMTGIGERRMWPLGTRSSDVASRAGQKAIEQSGIPPKSIDGLIHASVTRDFLEPATAMVVHERLGLSPRARCFDLSNACLGVMSAVELAAALVDAGRMEAVLVVAGEDGGPLLQQTLDKLTSDATIDRRALKLHFASLTIGSAAAAVLVTNDALVDPARHHRIHASVARADSRYHALCSGGVNGTFDMQTDSEALLQAGVALARDTFVEFLAETAWTHGDIDRTITHQVGRAHTRALYAALELDEKRGFITYPELGNVGSVALWVSLERAVKARFIEPGHRVGLFGIGSGLGSIMMGVTW